MSISSILTILWRRRIVVVPAMVLGLLMCAGVVLKAPPTYRASGSVILLNPPALPEVTPQNPSIDPQFQNAFARFGDISVVVDVLVRVLESQPVQDQLNVDGFDGVPEIAANRDFYRGPIVDVAAEADTAEQAIVNVNLLIDELTDQLDQLQTNTAETYRILPTLVVSPDRATRVFSGTLRLLILAIGASCALVVGSGLLADRLLKDGPGRRSPPRRAEPVLATTSGPASVQRPEGSEHHAVPLRSIDPIPHAEPASGPEPMSGNDPTHGSDVVEPDDDVDPEVLVAPDSMSTNGDGVDSGRARATNGASNRPSTTRRSAPKPSGRKRPAKRS